jgi:hypothetical protein
MSQGILGSALTAALLCIKPVAGGLCEGSRTT